MEHIRFQINYNLKIICIYLHTMLYQGIVIVGGLFAFIAAMGIGANDVANAYATAVGSRALTIKQAVVLAAEF